MKALEVTVTPHNHMVKLPADIPNGQPVRLVILIDDEKRAQPEGDVKELLSSVAEGLTSDDLHRIHDTGREQPQWHF
jgi:hypothetical protein